MEETNATTTQTLVNAAKRLVDELPEDTPPEKVLEHWLASARRDDEARGVIWPTIPADILGQSGTAWQIFPNFQIGQGLTSALCYSARPDPSYDPDKCVFEAAVYELYPKGEEPQAEWEFTPVGDPRWRSVLPQDFSNMAAVQQGMKSLASPAPGPTRTANAARSTCTASCRNTWAWANPARSRRRTINERRVRADGHTRRYRHRGTAAQVRTGAGEALATGRSQPVSGTQGRLRGLLRDRPLRTGDGA